jgi:hypothetical protein
LGPEPSAGRNKQSDSFAATGDGVGSEVKCRPIAGSLCQSAMLLTTSAVCRRAHP